MKQAILKRRVMIQWALCGAVLTGIPSAAQAQPASPDVPGITVTRAAGGRVLVEVAEGGVSVRKEIAADSSHTVISTPTDELQLRVSKGHLVVSSPRGSVTVTNGRAQEMEHLMALLQRSDAAVRGLALLKRMPANSRNFGQQALLLTRAVLELATGPSQAVAIHRTWVRQERERLLATRPAGAMVTRVGLGVGQIQGPGDCWDLYAKEAVRIAEDFSECTDDLKWYDALGWAGCSLIYTIRAEGAMAWFISCNGGIPFQA